MTATAELARPVASLSEMVEKYNSLANLLGQKTVNKFADRPTALKRLAKIEADVKEHLKVAPERKKRQKVFNYPPAEKLSALKAGTLRAEARDLLQNGATLGRVEQLIADWDVRQGKKPHRLEPRAYGLVRLLHNYCGYALREEVVGNDKLIYVMDRASWLAFKAASK